MNDTSLPRPQPQIERIRRNLGNTFLRSIFIIKNFVCPNETIKVKNTQNWKGKNERFGGHSFTETGVLV